MVPFVDTVYMLGLPFYIEHVLVRFVKNRNMLIITCVLDQKVCVTGYTCWLWMY